MKRFFLISILLYSILIQSQELNANVQVNFSQIGGSNTQVFKTLEKSLRDFINNTSWTGKRLQNFEKIKCSFALVITERPSQNTFKGSILIQAVRPVFNSQYESPLLNLNDGSFSFEYTENENLVFNERQFSGKNLIDVISFYAYVILGYDADSFQSRGGQPWFEKAQKIAQNSQNQNYTGWNQIEEPRNRGALINELLREQTSTLRNIFYNYHRAGLDQMFQQDQSSAKNIIHNELLRLREYDSNFQLNYPLNLFIEAKKNEIFELFNNNNTGAAINLNGLKQLLTTLSPKDADSKWNQWK